MELRNNTELESTKSKLADFESRYEELRQDTGMDARVRELTMRSLKRYINQFKEEIARYKAHQPT
jgi:hypothetical protein